MLDLNRTLTIRLFLACLFVSSSLLAAPPVEQATPAAETGAPSRSDVKTVRLLTIGNSFSRNATRFLNDLATANGQKLVHHPIYVGGASMQLHADKAMQHKADPEADAARYADGSTLKQRLLQEPWDVVTIQQASRISHDAQTYRPYAAQLRDVVQQYAPQAQLLVHQTWAYREDDPRFTRPSGRAGEPTTHTEMHQQLRAAYVGIAEELNAGLIPVGDAFQLATEDPKWGFRPDVEFDIKNAEFPSLPDQRHSLHVGWRWRKQGGNHRLGMDGHHANLAGEFLGSCVFYEVLFDTPVTSNPFTPPNLDPEFATFLKQTAHRAVAQTKGR